MTRSFGTPFPGAQLAAATAQSPGCRSADDPTALIESDLLSRNLARGCRLVVDLGGYSYDLARSPGRAVPRSQNQVWQQLALAYFRHSSTLLVMRFHRGAGFSPTTAATVRHWPVLAGAGAYAVRTPLHSR